MIKILPFIAPVIFFIIAVFTINDYGMNSDSPVHFARGQAHVRFILTGKTDYNDLAKFCRGEDGHNSRVDHKTGQVCDRHWEGRVSEFQSRSLDFNYFSKNIYGHPSTSDILLALSNQIFFIKLGWVEDIPAYHLYSIFATFLMALTISFWVKKTFGTFASIIAVLSFYFFPLLLGEQHFNIKDPPMAAFFTISLYFFWLSFTENKARFMFFSAIAAGISFGTKFNYLFAPFILLPWTMVYFKKTAFNIKRGINLSFKKLPKKLAMLFILYPFIVFSIFYFTWPDLWPDPLHNVPLVFQFYKDLGTIDCPQELFSSGWLACSNFIPILYFFTTIPIVTLSFFFIGFFVSIYIWKKHNYVTILWLTFLLLTIVRVSVPGSSIYGGIRQIMEFISPTAMISGIGALYLRNFLVSVLSKSKLLSSYGRKKIIFGVSILLMACYVPIAIKVTEIHPNENVYFNPLIGGIKGASEKNVYGYGNTYANGYYQAVKWLNQNAEKDAKVALIWGLAQNISRTSLREDFSFTPEHLSAYNQKGEYQIATLEQNSPVFQTFWYRYVDKFLVPIYTKEVDGVPLFKIWKNDAKYARRGVNPRHEELKQISVEKKNGEVVIELDKIKMLKRLEIRFSDAKKCRGPFGPTQLFISRDNKEYAKQHEEVHSFASNEIDTYKADFSHLFTGEEARFIKLIIPQNYPCDLYGIEFSLYSL